MKTSRRGDPSAPEPRRAATAMGAIEAGAHSAGMRLAGRLGRHAFVYTLAIVATLVSGLLSVVIFTRFLDPSTFGELAILTTVASLVTILINLPILPGTMRRVYGVADEEDVGDEEQPGERASDPRLALATGLAMTVAIGAVLFGVAASMSADLADLFVADSGDGDLIVLAVGAGAAAAVMRLARNFLRLQRRSVAYLVVTVVYALGGTLLAIPLLESGAGVAGILEALIIANVAAMLLNLFLLRLDIRLAASFREAVEIVRAGAYYIPLIASFQTIQLADTLLVAHFANFSETGLYRVAQRIAVPVSYGTSVFQQAWAPMRRDLVQVAADKDEGRRSLIGRLVTHYCVFVAAMVLSVAVFADQLVLLAASGYSEAADLVPLTTVSVAGHGFFVIVYRLSKVPSRRRWFLGLALLAALVFVAASAVLIPALGAIGAPIAAIIAWSMATGGMLIVTQIRGEPIQFEHRRLLILATATSAALAMSHWLIPPGFVGAMLEAILLLAWGALLVLTEVVPRHELAAFRRFVGSAVGESKRRFRTQISELPPDARETVDRLLVQRTPPALLAAERGVAEDDVLRDLVRALRAAAGGGADQPTDAALAEVMITPRPHAEYEARLHAIVAEGADPIEVDLLVRVAAATTAWRPPFRR